MVIATLFQAGTALIDNDMAFFVCCVIARLIDGVGDSFTHTACFSIISIEFSEEKEKYIGRAESVIGFGLMAGPVIGSFIYAYAGYMNTFLVFTALELVVIVLV